MRKRSTSLVNRQVIIAKEKKAENWENMLLDVQRHSFGKYAWFSALKSKRTEKTQAAQTTVETLVKYT